MKIIFIEEKFRELDPNTVEFLRLEISKYIEDHVSMGTSNNALLRSFNRSFVPVLVKQEDLDRVPNKDLELSWKKYSKRSHNMPWAIPNGKYVGEFLSIIKLEPEDGMARANKRIPIFKSLISKLKGR